MDKFNRAVRRHHTSRLKKNRANYWNWQSKDPRCLGMVVHTPKLCSCFMCGNARKFYRRLDIDEISHLEILKYEMCEVDE